MWRSARKGRRHLLRLRSRKGQSILEYVVIATVIVLAILAIRGAMGTSANNILNNAASKTDEGATFIGSNLFIGDQ